ncbi:MAG TPA: 2-C-methyl-D-erythritol 2,4-cyclodiphosphate synthase [Pirellulaceae bacterium]|nr:2-C-methyl-D-erythritol 2,4-cyclodiphosphate synthase [Pirellulaceae bacterium]HMO91875.1 2-C-methyl-D-erythritol 2,4-cyclodiphosphate synthase [Pirellulaceae bacterium]HMP69715.1 2-C-methyl-D-erythritol 2,4-cyclodiphosphate synthase [Pirellulaceae bacterium]
MQIEPWHLRVGIGHDTHRLGVGGPLRIGGIDIEFDRHLIGHSDADVLLHAVTDAILGGAAMDDIGTIFPDNDPANAKRDSREMLRIAYELVRQAGYRIVNIDCVVFAERPKLSPYRETLKSALAACLGIDVNQVGIKAKTGEQVDAVGNQLAISAQCVALLCRDQGAG